MKHFFFIGALICSSFVSAQTQQFTTAGSHTFAVPSSVLSVKVECIGAGGGGGRVTPSNLFDNDAGGGGGGGAYATGLVNVTGGNTYSCYVGAGGYNTGTSVDGEDSYWDAGAEVLAKGGATRSGNDNDAGALGGQASNWVQRFIAVEMVVMVQRVMRMEAEEVVQPVQQVKAVMVQQLMVADLS